MIVSTRELTRTFGSFKAVDSISLDFEPGRIHAIVGENGAGKSTFLKLMFGLLSPSNGSVLIDGREVSFRSSLDAIRAGLGMVQQHFTLVETLSAIDNIMLGAEIVGAGGVLRRHEAITRLEKLLPSASLRVPWDVPVNQLAVGQRQRVEILKLLFRESQVLFLDEPTAVLAPQEIDELFEVLRALRSQGRTIVLITHKMNEVLDNCDTCSVLRLGRLVSRGDVRNTTSDAIVEAMIGRTLPPRSLERRPSSPELVLQASRVSESASSRRGRMQNISLSVHAGEIVGVAGVEGSGQSAFVEAVMGLRSFKGDLRVLGTEVSSVQQVRSLGVGLVPEDRHNQALWMDETCRLNYVVGLEQEFMNGGLIDFDAVHSKSQKWSEDFDVRTSSLDVSVSTLSGGNQQKLIFAREVSGRRPRLLVCHQPTRGVDLAAIDLIFSRLETLRNEGLGMLILSSDLDELMDVCDRLYVFFDGRVTAEFTRDKFDRMKIGAAMTGEATHA